MLIQFKTIPHLMQRYETAGDWYRKKGMWRFRVSALSDRRYELLVLAHELIEFILCRVGGVRAKDVDAFDRQYEQSRRDNQPTACGCDHRPEPGDDPHAPYYFQHLAATQCEKIMAEVMKVNWKMYEKALEELSA